MAGHEAVQKGAMAVNGLKHYHLIAQEILHPSCPCVRRYLNRTSLGYSFFVCYP